MTGENRPGVRFDRSAELSPIKAITVDGVFIILGMFRSALENSRMAVHMAKDAHSSSDILSWENWASNNEHRANDLSKILTMLGQDRLVDQIRHDVYTQDSEETRK